MAETHNGVDENDVPKIVEGLIGDGFTKIIAKKQPDGNWTITGEP